MGQNAYSSAVFTEGVDLCTQILSAQARPPSTIISVRKLETLGYPTAKTASSAFGRFDTIRECDGQTDGYAARSIYSACKASFAECRKNLPTIIFVLVLS